MGRSCADRGMGMHSRLRRSLLDELCPAKEVEWLTGLTPTQVFLIISVSANTVMVNLGMGKHMVDIDPANLETIGLLSNVASTFSMLAAVLSKTSFAVTLLRITKGYIKIIVWVIIAIMNVAMGLGALFTWVKCDPVRKTWNPMTPGTCWDSNAMMIYSVFAAGQCAPEWMLGQAGSVANESRSYLRGNGRRSRSLALEDYLDLADEDTGKGWRCARNEHGHFVSQVVSSSQHSANNLQCCSNRRHQVHQDSAARRRRRYL